MHTFVCQRCGYVAFHEAPQSCPICNAPKEEFRLDENVIKSPQDPKNLTELEKKHIPVVWVNRECGLIKDGCLDLNVKIGEILHVMEPNHYIMYLDFYLDYKFICRYHLTASLVNPVVGIHLRIKDNANLVVLENCNLHGRWITQIQI